MTTTPTAGSPESGSPESRIPAPSAGVMRDVYLLDPSWTYLNHGSFGACPRPVFEAYQRLQMELERQPVEFLVREYEARLDAARQRLADYIGAEVSGLVFVPNTTTGVNTVARALELHDGDEVLLTDQEYGGCVYAWEAVARATGARLVTVPLPSPLVDPAEVVAALAAAATDRTRVVFFSHLAAVTGAVLPAAEICHWARDRSILSVVDGAHVPGQLPLDLAVVGPDAYIGNCHKWLCAPKGSAFCWVSEPLRDVVQPLVVSWGAAPGTSFAQRHGWRGTYDPAAVLSVPAAISFTERHSWPAVAARGRGLAAGFVAAVAERFGGSPLYQPGSAWHAQLASAPVPWSGSPDELQRRLREDFRIEVPVHAWSGRTLVRASFAAYNDVRHTERLTTALASVL
ncbi:MAG: aminotransferase class V-fold PLP-dependent enzyme [Actinobacteria bacterium]|nr:aminotransferase class V-fold PLP-dependent enzyme [Actinomycetota bacterium]MBI3686373.1 aminotransferase class V-fold PLP-dependent enzyme [Actinomycetota bacterium]